MAGRAVDGPDRELPLGTVFAGIGGVDCADPVAISTTVEYQWHEIGGVSDSTPFCGTTPAWGTTYFAVTIPAGGQLQVNTDVLGVEGEWLRVAILASCYGWREASGAYPEEAFVDSEQTVIVAVGADGPVTEPLVFEYSMPLLTE